MNSKGIFVYPSNKPIWNIVTTQLSQGMRFSARMLHYKIWTYLPLFITKLILYVDSNAVAKYSHLNFSTQLKNNVLSKVCKNIHLVEEV